MSDAIHVRLGSAKGTVADSSIAKISGGFANINPRAESPVWMHLPIICRRNQTAAHHKKPGAVRSIVPPM